MKVYWLTFGFFFIVLSFSFFFLGGLRYEVQSYKNEVNIWFSNAIGRPCTLFRCFSSNHNFCLNKIKSASMGREVQSMLNFSNEAQFLLISEESVSDLSHRVSTSMFLHWTVASHIVSKFLHSDVKRSRLAWAIFCSEYNCNMDWFSRTLKSLRKYFFFLLFFPPHWLNSGLIPFLCLPYRIIDSPRPFRKLVEDFKNAPSVMILDCSLKAWLAFQRVEPLAAE